MWHFFYQIIKSFFIVHQIQRWFQMVHVFTSIHILNFEIRIRNSDFGKSEFRIPHFKKKVVDGIFVFEDATSGSVHGVGQGIQN